MNLLTACPLASLLVEREIPQPGWQCDVINLSRCFLKRFKRISIALGTEWILEAFVLEY
jgi:hypothetical protein